MDILALAILILAIIAIWGSSRLLQIQGLPKGKIIYTDTHLWQSVVTPLFDPELGLTGKPDYIVRKGNLIIPIEVKSSYGNSSPTPSHILQLAAYCCLIQKTYHQRPPHGIIHYTVGNKKNRSINSQTYKINYTKKLETSLIETINQMRSLENQHQIKRSHNAVRRCNRCGYRLKCDQKL
ncbi:MAG: Dna2/Cas4 domain-containing protein [Anaerolineales bacterium]|nr:Dna2/Cas4 domain-containing protein [Anaerolineales bacterium]